MGHKFPDESTPEPKSTLSSTSREAFSGLADGRETKLPAHGTTDYGHSLLAAPPGGFFDLGVRV